MRDHGTQRTPKTAAAALSCMALTIATAAAQPNPISWWPKLHRDARNTGLSAAIGIATDAHVIWTAQISPPVTSELHSTPVFSGDNTRLYVGGLQSKLTAVNAVDGSIAWTLTLGNGSGVLHQTPTIAADGSIFVGSWDAAAPYDGFSKIADAGTSAQIVWTYAMRQVLAAPLLLPGGRIVLAGRHETDGWGYFGLTDLGTSVQRDWFVPTSSAGGTPVASADGQWVFGGTDSDKRFRQINAATGAVQANLTLNSYVWASTAAISADGQYVFVGEGMTFGNPNPQTEGKIYAFKRDAAGTLQAFASLALNAGHLNGGIGALRPFVAADTANPAHGLLRIYVPANGIGASGASLVAVQFDPAAPSKNPPLPAFTKMWSVSLGGGSSAYPAASATRDGVIYTVGPANHTLYAVRDAGAAARPLWTLPLTSITRVAGWTPNGQRCGREIVATPDGTLYWLAADGYLYALRGWPTGDMDGDADVDAADVALLQSAIADRPAYDLRFPEINAVTIGDLDGDGTLAAADATLLNNLVNGG